MIEVLKILNEADKLQEVRFLSLKQHNVMGHFTLIVNVWIKDEDWPEIHHYEHISNQKSIVTYIDQLVDAFPNINFTHTLLGKFDNLLGPCEDIIKEWFKQEGIHWIYKKSVYDKVYKNPIMPEDLDKVIQ